MLTLAVCVLYCPGCAGRGRGTATLMTSAPASWSAAPTTAPPRSCHTSAFPLVDNIFSFIPVFKTSLSTEQKRFSFPICDIFFSKKLSLIGLLISISLPCLCNSVCQSVIPSQEDTGTQRTTAARRGEHQAPPAVYLLTPVPCRCTADRPCVHGEGPCLSNSECATQGHYYFCGGQDCVDTGEFLG